MLLDFSDESREQCDDYEPQPSWDEQSIFGDQFDNEIDHRDVDNSDMLVSQPRQVGLLAFISMLAPSCCPLE